MKKVSFLKFSLGLAIILSITLTGSLAWAPVYSDGCISVNKECKDFTSEAILYRITYGNCGVVDLTDVSVVDITFNNTIFEGNLLVGQSDYADIWVTIGGCGEVTNTVKAEGTFGTYYGTDTTYAEASVKCGDPCDGENCTLTPGYWKTHSINGPAPYDSVWSQIGEDTPFFSSGFSYYEVLWTPPRGNPYYILAHAYIAAELNFIKDASSPIDVDDAFESAGDLFGAYTPDDIKAFKKDKDNEIPQDFLELAETLDNYNNGMIGPGHCSD